MVMGSRGVGLDVEGVGKLVAMPLVYSIPGTYCSFVSLSFLV